MAIYTTLNKIREHQPCEPGWKKLLYFLRKRSPDDELLAFSTVVESNGLEDAIWCARSAPEHDRTWRLFAVQCARRVQSLMTAQPSIAAINTAEAHANGLATGEELSSAGYAALRAAYAIERSFLDSAGPTTKIQNAAIKAAAYAAVYVTEYPAKAIVRAADAAWAATLMSESEREAQTAKFLEMVS